LESWWNGDSKKCAFIVFETKDGKWVKNGDFEARLGQNPAQKKSK